MSQYTQYARRPIYAIPQRVLRCYALACLFSVTIGLYVPVALAMLYASGQPATLSEHNESPKKWKHPPPKPHPELKIVFDQFAQLLFGATLLCGPGAFILTLSLLKILQGRVQSSISAHDMIVKGASGGALLAFANIPGYLCGFIIGWQEPFAEIRIALLFLAAGAVSGGWIGWQAWRIHHSEAGFFPQFSLRSLLLCTLGIGTLLAVFSPSR